jgi:hypothetical protein
VAQLGRRQFAIMAFPRAPMKKAKSQCAVGGAADFVGERLGGHRQGWYCIRRRR